MKTGLAQVEIGGGINLHLMVFSHDITIHYVKLTHFLLLFSGGIKVYFPIYARLHELMVAQFLISDISQ